MKISPLASMNSYLNRFDIALRQAKNSRSEDQSPLTQKQFEYGVFIDQQSNSFRSPLEQFSQDVSSLNDIFMQKILMKSNQQIYSKLGSSYQGYYANLKASIKYFV